MLNHDMSSRSKPLRLVIPETMEGLCVEAEVVILFRQRVSGSVYICWTNNQHLYMLDNI